MANLADWRQVLTLVRAHRAQLRFCLRVTAAGLLAFAIAQVLTIPLHGLWVVLTAVVVTQMSAGGSLRATVEYIIGTFGGAVYAAITGVLIPHTTPIAQGGVLALTIAPLALAAALNPNFRVAPFSAVLVLLISGQLSEGFEVLLERASRKRPFTCEGSPWSPARYAAEAQNSRIEQSDARLSIISFRIGRTLDQQGARCLLLAVRPESANHQWRKIPPGELHY